MKNLVIGLGEVGSAIQKVLGCDGWDLSMRDQSMPERADVLHICFPYLKSEGDRFIQAVNFYRGRCGAKLIIVHSTVPVGTCDQDGWVHSPVRGVHPYLEEGIRTFVKFFGGVGAFEAAQIFVEKGIMCSITEKAATTEALKLWDTTQYGVMIMLEKEIHEYCKQNDVDYDVVYGEANKTYNEGYMKLGRPDVVRPWLRHMDGPVGGHCVIPNAYLLDSQAAIRLVKDNSQL